MGKSLISLVAKELGVEIGEEFETTHFVGRFKFTPDGLLTEFEEGRFLNWINASPFVLKLLVTGRCEIIKLPFEPKDGEYYWTYNSDDFSIIEINWTEHFADYCRKACGCVFCTEQEAIRARPSRYKELTGKDWSGEDG